MSWKETTTALVKTYESESFSSIIDQLQRLSVICDELDHHPDFKVYDYKKIRFELRTHDKDRITEKDHNLAAEIDKIFI